ncbi:unnamed protein product [Linum trigynum]|uniref:Uncharacterized protein n=1 Tax=Linum trigynum TaxID=586398 RepID=A0AAV2GQV3_9ROSI
MAVEPVGGDAPVHRALVSPTTVPTGDNQKLCGEASAVLNEYGSNLLDPNFGNRKRPLGMMDGGGGNPPTPKKKFVEMNDSKEKVEVASLEWPQGDK